MKQTTIVGALGILAAFAASGIAQTVNPAKVKVNGIIGLDSTYAQVLKAFGKPKADGKPRKEGCIGAREKTVEYSGLSLYFMDGDSRNGKTFEAKSINVTSAKWTVSGIKVGDTSAAVRQKLGRKYTAGQDPDGGGDAMWVYDMDDKFGPGATTVTFKKGKVIAIGTAYQVC